MLAGEEDDGEVIARMVTSPSESMKVVTKGENNYKKVVGHANPRSIGHNVEKS
jgi:hypothetical protein